MVAQRLRWGQPVVGELQGLHKLSADLAQSRARALAQEVAIESKALTLSEVAMNLPAANGDAVPVRNVGIQYNGTEDQH